MNKLTREDLLSLEQYAAGRSEFRAAVMEHKKNRQVALGDRATLYFEDEQTIRYQIQEMLRIEKVFEADGIQDELDTYNPLLPDGSNWKATFMLEYDDPVERKDMLGKLLGVEKQVWAQVSGHDKVWPIADEDLEREDEEKTSSVHFLRFELTPAMVADAIAGASIIMGIDHPAYPIEGVEVASAIRDSLAGDLANAS
jgi:hypothetical protein